MPKIEIAKLEKVSNEVLLKVGVSRKDAQIITDTIVFAHQTGKGTHGITRLPIYVKKIKNGDLNPENSTLKIKDKGVVSILDAQNGFGQVVVYEAMNLAINKAMGFGIGAVGVRNSNNFGTAAYFLDMAASRNFIAIVMANSAPAIAPWGGNVPMFGTNPIGFSFPTKNGIAPIVFDMATSSVARGKIRLAAKNDEKIPFGWALDVKGNPTDDPLEALKGTLIPIGEHKGSGLSMVIDILSGLLTGSEFAGGVKPLNTEGAKSRNGHFVLAIDIDFFMEQSEYFQKIDYLLEKYKENNPNKSIFYPGENSYNNKMKNMEAVVIGEKPLLEINQMLVDLDIDLRFL